MSPKSVIKYHYFLHNHSLKTCEWALSLFKLEIIKWKKSFKKGGHSLHQNKFRKGEWLEDKEGNYK